MTLEDVTPRSNDSKSSAAAKKKDQKPAEPGPIVITRDGKVPKAQLPKKKVEKKVESEDGLD